MAYTLERCALANKPSVRSSSRIAKKTSPNVSGADRLSRGGA
jgi:hypothetical protein